jgi:hypothetical protein
MDTRARIFKLRRRFVNDRACAPSEFAQERARSAPIARILARNFLSGAAEPQRVAVAAAALGSPRASGLDHRSRASITHGSDSPRASPDCPIVKVASSFGRQAQRHFAQGCLVPLRTLAYA